MKNTTTPPAERQVFPRRFDDNRIDSVRTSIYELINTLDAFAVNRAALRELEPQK